MNTFANICIVYILFFICYPVIAIGQYNSEFGAPSFNESGLPSICKFTDVRYIVTFESETTSEEPLLHPWSQAEIDQMKEVLGIEDALDLDGSPVQNCVPLGVLDLIQRWVGQTDASYIFDNIPVFEINIEKREPSSSAYSAFFDGRDITMIIDTDEVFNEEKVPALIHEMTHAMVKDSFTNYSIVASEGLAVAMEMLVAPELGYTDADVVLMRNLYGRMRRCEALNIEGIGMRNAASFNSSFNRNRYDASACFMLRLQMASVGASGRGTFFSDLRDIAREEIYDTDFGLLGAQRVHQSIRDAAPLCIEGQPKDDWLQGQHIFTVNQELPMIDIYAGPLHYTGFNFPGWDKFIPFKRYRQSGNYERAEVIPTYAYGNWDYTNLFNVVVTSGWDMTDNYGTTVLSNQPLFAYTPLGSPTNYSTWASTDSGSSVDNHLQYCSVDTNGDGTAVCYIERDIWMNVDYIHPETQALISKTSHYKTYVVARPWIDNHELIDFRGIATSFNTGNVRITLIRAGIQFDAELEGGTFAPYTDKAYQLEQYNVSSCVTSSPIVACELGSSCAATQTSYFRHLFKDYRGPIKIERIFDGQLVDARIYTKVARELDVLYETPKRFLQPSRPDDVDQLDPDIIDSTRVYAMPDEPLVIKPTRTFGSMKPKARTTANLFSVKR